MTTLQDSLKVKRKKRTRSYMPSEKSLANLIQYPKGVSGNQGSGNGYSLTAELKHALNKERRLALVESTIEGAINREPTPFKELWERVEGKAAEQPVSPVVQIQIVHVERGGRVIEGQAREGRESLQGGGAGDGVLPKSDSEGDQAGV